MAAPQDFTVVSLSDCSIKASWTLDPAVDGYKLYYGNNHGGPYNGIEAIEGHSPINVGLVDDFTITGLDPTKKYYLVVTSYTGSIESTKSVEGSCIPVPHSPTLQSVISYTHALKTTWTQVISGGYYLYYGELSGGPYQGTDAVEGPSPIDVGNTLSFTIHGLNPTKTYYISIRAYNQGGESNYSNEGFGIPNDLPIQPPTNVAVENLYPYEGRVRVSWDSVPNATAYKLHYGLTSGGPYQGTGALEGNSPIGVSGTYFDLSLPPGILFYFAVKSFNYNSQEYSEFSSEVSITTTKITKVWYDPKWPRRFNFHIDENYIIGNPGDIHSNFPIPLKITGADADEIFTYCRPDGKDLLITNFEGSKQSHELSIFDPLNHLIVIFFKVSSLKVQQSNTFHLYYGNLSTLVDQSNKTGVWEDYLVVYHMEESGAPLKDSTKNEFNGTNIHSIDTLQDALIGKSWYFKGLASKGYVTTPPDDLMNILSYEVTIVAKSTKAFGDDSCFVIKGKPGSSETTQFGMKLSTGSPTYLKHMYESGGLPIEVYKVVANALNEWRFYNISQDHEIGRVSISYDDSTTNWDSLPLLDGSNSELLRFGFIDYGLGVWQNFGQFYLSEFRFGSIVRSEFWKKTEYYSLLRNDDFVVFDDFERYVTSLYGPAEVVPKEPIKFCINSITFIPESLKDFELIPYLCELIDWVLAQEKVQCTEISTIRNFYNVPSSDFDPDLVLYLIGVPERFYTGLDISQKKALILIFSEWYNLKGTLQSLNYILWLMGLKGIVYEWFDINKWHEDGDPDWTETLPPCAIVLDLGFVEEPLSATLEQDFMDLAAYLLWVCVFLWEVRWKKKIIDEVPPYTDLLYIDTEVFYDYTPSILEEPFFTEEEFILSEPLINSQWFIWIGEANVYIGGISWPIIGPISIPYAGHFIGDVGLFLGGGEWWHIGEPPVMGTYKLVIGGAYPLAPYGKYPPIIGADGQHYEDTLEIYIEEFP